MLADWRKLVEQGDIESFIPVKMIESTKKGYMFDDNRTKINFAAFLRHLALYYMSAPAQPSVRDMARESGNPIWQDISGLPEVTSQGMADYVDALPEEFLKKLAHKLQRYALQERKYQQLNTKIRLSFDAKTVEAPKLEWNWAANNGDRNAVLLHFTVDLDLGTMGHFVVYKEDTSCNSVFPELVDRLQPNSLVAFDRGYNRLTVLQELMKQGIHWVTRGSQAYKVTSLKDRPLPPDTVTRCGATVIRDEWVLVGGHITQRWTITRPSNNSPIV